MSYNTSYATLPTFSTNSIGYNDGSMNRTIVMPNSVNTTIATYNNVGPGVYLFVLTGDYHPTTGVPVTPDRSKNPYKLL